MKNRLLYQQHIMWYESKMVNETLDSLHQAIKNSTLPVDLRICLNSQTYIEKPQKSSPEGMFEEFLDHPILQSAEIIHKTDDELFYNIGDWRREVYSQEHKYTVWGESDCLIPEDYFYILSSLGISEPHVVSLASRKMGDNSWGVVEFEGMESYSRSWPERNDSIPIPYFARDHMNLTQLHEINNRGDVKIIKNHKPKIDGALLALSPKLPPFIPEDLHFAREDYCANLIFIKYGIPQYVIVNRMKGHNYYHPLKRTNTKSTRTDSTYKKYEAESFQALMRFINNK